MCQKGFIGCHGARPDKLSFDDLMIRFCGAPEREKERGERERLRDKMMKVFEASRGTSRSNNKGNDIHERVKRRERTRPKIQALRFLLGNYQKVGIKHKCIIMLTINTIMSALLASMFGCGDDVCGGMRRVWMCLWGKGVYLLASRLALVLFILFQEHNLENQLNQKHWRILSSLSPPIPFYPIWISPSPDPPTHFIDVTHKKKADTMRLFWNEKHMHIIMWRTIK